MKVIVTCGPGFEPIDQVRRITNFSTGELGVQLCNALARAGFEVFCFKGSGATHPGPREQCHLSLFDTNDDLLELLTQASTSHEIAAVFQVAALCDYKVKRVEDDQGRGCQSAKIASRSGALTINLEPATKVIGKMRELFRTSILVGWKYELVGTRNDALASTVLFKYSRPFIGGAVSASATQSFSEGFVMLRSVTPSRFGLWQSAVKKRRASHARS